MDENDEEAPADNLAIVEEEEDDFVKKDEHDDENDPEDDDDNLADNHGKMLAFQVSLRSVLQRQIDKLYNEVSESKRLVSLGARETEEAARTLHDEQKSLVLEEDNVRITARKLDRTQRKRENREVENKEYRVEVERSDGDIELRIVHNEELRSRVNDLSGQSLHCQLQRLEMENAVGVDQAATDKGEADFKLAQEAKQFQDKYIGQLGEEVEQLEQQCGQYTDQRHSMDQGTLETMDNVRRAEQELVSVRSEVSRVVTNWTNTVININKRDEALNNFREAIDHQKLDLKIVKTKIDSTKSEILECQAEHEQMTGIHRRVHKLAGKHQTEIKKYERMTAEEKLELGRLGRVRNETEDVLNKTEAAVKLMEAEEVSLRSKLEKIDQEKKSLEEEIMELVRDQVTTCRSSSWTDRKVKEVQASIKEMETKQGEASNRLAELEGDIAVARLRLEADNHKLEELNVASKMLSKQESEHTSSLEKTIKSIDKIQNLIDIATKLKTSLTEKSGGEDLTPLEADIKKHKQELEDIINYCAGAKRQWSKMQNVLIKAHRDKDEYKTELEQSRNKFGILEDKKKSIEADIRTLTVDLNKLKKRIDNFDTNIKKLNVIVCDEREKLDNIEEDRINKGEERIMKMTNLEELIEELKESVRKLEVARHFTVEKLRDADKELFDWEDKVKACKETSDFLSDEKAKDGELESLKCEVHFLDQKLKDVNKATADLSSSLENYVLRRESIFEKINAEKAVDVEKKKEKVGKTMTAKKINDMRNAIKKLAKEVKNLETKLEDSKSYLTDLNDKVTVYQHDISTAHDNIRDIDDQVAEAQGEREVRFSGVVQLQQKAKWYQDLR